MRRGSDWEKHSWEKSSSSSLRSPPLGNNNKKVPLTWVLLSQMHKHKQLMETLMSCSSFIQKTLLHDLSSQRHHCVNYFPKPHKLQNKVLLIKTKRVTSPWHAGCDINDSSIPNVRLVGLYWMVKCLWEAYVCGSGNLHCYGTTWLTLMRC